MASDCPVLAGSCFWLRLRLCRVLQSTNCQMKTSNKPSLARSSRNLFALLIVASIFSRLRMMQGLPSRVSILRLV